MCIGKVLKMIIGAIVILFCVLQNISAYSIPQELSNESGQNVNYPTEQHVLGHHPEMWVIKGQEGFLTGNERITRDTEEHIKENKKKQHDLELNQEESGMIFLHALGRRNKRQIKKRETQKSDHKLDHVNANKTELNHEESGLIFLHALGKKQKREVKVVKRENKPKDVNQYKNENKDDEQNLEAEESALVFLPSLKRQRRETDTKAHNCNCQTTTRAPVSHHSNIKRETSEVSSQKQSKNKDTNQESAKDSNSHGFDEEESGLVFLPSIGRQKREANTKMGECNCQTTTRAPVTDHSYNKRETNKDSREKNEDNKDKNQEPAKDSNSQGFDEEESALVFLPSIRRQRREADSKKNNCNCQTTTTAPVTDYSHKKRETHEDLGKGDNKDKNEEDSNNQGFDEEESGLVFLPSIRRQRREADGKTRDCNCQTTTRAPVAIHSSQKRETNKDETSKQQAEHKDGNEKSEKDTKIFDKEESGLIFLTSLGKKQ